MEARAAANNQQRKRARDDEEAADNTEILQQPKKKQEYSSDDEGQRRYQFHDGIGVFDFPWLKEEGVIFDSDAAERSACFEDNFTPPCHETHRFCDETSSPQNLCVSPAGGVVTTNHGDGKSGDDDSLWSSLAVDDLEAVDCIWSCVIDHPLDIGIGLINNYKG